MRLTFLLLLANAALLIGAENVSFSYDSAGNRVKREIVIEKKSAPADPHDEYFSEMLSEKEIRLYPNPTEGNLIMEISGYEDADQCEIAAYNLSGRLIITKIVDGPVTDLDITSQPNGIYMFHIILNGKESSWKIIKK